MGRRVLVGWLLHRLSRSARQFSTIVKKPCVTMSNNQEVNGNTNNFILNFLTSKIPIDAKKLHELKYPARSRRGLFILESITFFIAKL